MKMKFKYDKGNDVLYANVGEPRSGLAEEVGGGIAVKFDLHDKKPIGFIVIDYMKRVNRNILQPIPNFEKIKLPTYKNLSTH
jgi:uncharacterized protein YuzE